MDGERHSEVRTAGQVGERGEARETGRETGRVEAFSDGVFAIAVTLLILQIPIPDTRTTGTTLLSDLVSQGWAYFAYVVSFLTILIMWINHHILFRQIGRIDRAFLILNGLLLMVITFLDFPTALVARYFNGSTADARTAMLVYAGTSIVMAVCFSLLWFYAARGGRLLAAHADRATVGAITRAYRFGPLYYVVIFLIAFVNVPASLVLTGLMALYFAVFGKGVV